MKGNSGPGKITYSFKNAFRGIAIAVRTQLNFKIHLVAIAVVVSGGFYFSIGKPEWCMLIICFALVTSAECFNTALEFLTDLVSPDYHPLAGKVKDISAGAVLISALFSVVIALIIFIPKIFIR